MSKNITVELQSATITKSATGAEVKSWATYATVYGSTRTLRGNSYYAAQQTANETDIELYIWYRTDVLAKHRVLIGGLPYEISAPPENIDMKNKELLLRLRHVE